MLVQKPWAMRNLLTTETKSSDFSRYQVASVG
jgi:hypothetical protein